MNSKIPPIPSSQITPKQLYLSRRDFIKTGGALAGGLLLAACGAVPQPTASPTLPAATIAPSLTPTTAASAIPTQTPRPSPTPLPTDELGDPLNSFEDITQYNNYYEFSTDKQAVAKLAQDFHTSPWQIEVAGLVSRPGIYSLDELLQRYPPEDRIYRLRCVEGWSMVIPWLGFPLAKLLKDIEPTSAARYVRFETLSRPAEMPGLKDPLFPWPYREGLRLDEAMHDLTLLASGLYGGELPAQNGGGLRLVVPWKYGFKSIKAITRIELTAEQPSSMWSEISPREYGFYANVNPDVNHPRWSQFSERRIGEPFRRHTLLFNGYADQVAQLYTGMDLKKNY